MAPLEGIGRVTLWRILNAVATAISKSGLLRLPLIGPFFRGSWVLLKRSIFVSRSTITVNGFKLIIGPAPYFAGISFQYGPHEPGTTRLFRELLKPGMTVVDVGAHVGYYTLLAARQVGEVGRVYAFEPHPDNYNMLVRNVENNGYANVFAIRKAIDSELGCRVLFLGHGTSLTHSLYADKSLRADSIRVETTTLDAYFVQEGWPRIDLVKMDIEGAEPAALRGMKELIAHSPRVKLIVEFGPQHLAAAGVEPSTFIQELQDAGFRIRLIDDEQGLLPMDLSCLLKGIKGPYVNLLCDRGERGEEH